MWLIYLQSVLGFGQVPTNFHEAVDSGLLKKMRHMNQGKALDFKHWTTLEDAVASSDKHEGTYHEK